MQQLIVIAAASSQFSLGLGGHDLHHGKTKVWALSPLAKSHKLKPNGTRQQ